MSLKNQALSERACPCGNTASNKRLVYADCCARYLNDFENTPAPDAVRLMRSRYSAFAKNRADYLLATWHASARPTDLFMDDATKWLGLDIKRHTVIDTDNASVEFVARYRLAGRATRLHEVSLFVRELGRWYYLKGEDLAP